MLAKITHQMVQTAMVSGGFVVMKISGSVKQKTEGKKMICKGVVKGNVVVLEEGAKFPDGAPVEILLLARAAEVLASLENRHAALNRIFSLQLPVADWEQMEEEIIKGAME
jgi:hypothetical protein